MDIAQVLAQDNESVGMLYFDIYRHGRVIKEQLYFWALTGEMNFRGT